MSFKGFSKRGKYWQYLDVEHWREYSTVYALLVFLIMLEASMVKYLPWSATTFSKASGFIIIENIVA